MARWSLRVPHYLNIPGTEWEQKETDLLTGKQARKIYPVPMYLDPKDPADCNYPGEIIVCHIGKGHPKDKEFVGPPGPDMEPLDDEAKELSRKESRKWGRGLEGLPDQVDAGEIAELRAQVAELQAQLVKPQGRRV